MLSIGYATLAEARWDPFTAPTAFTLFFPLQNSTKKNSFSSPISLASPLPSLQQSNAQHGRTHPAPS